MHGSKLIDGNNFMFVHECITIPVIMHRKTPESIEFMSKLGFTQYNLVLRKQQSIVKSQMNTFSTENIHDEYSVLGYSINLYFHDHKLAIEKLG